MNALQALSKPGNLAAAAGLGLVVYVCKSNEEVKAEGRVERPGNLSKALTRSVSERAEKAVTAAVAHAEVAGTRAAEPWSESALPMYGRGLAVAERIELEPPAADSKGARLTKRLSENLGAACKVVTEPWSEVGDPIIGRELSAALAGKEVHVPADKSLGAD